MHYLTHIKFVIQHRCYQLNDQDIVRGMRILTKERKKKCATSWVMEPRTFLSPSEDSILHYVINLLVVYLYIYLCLLVHLSLSTSTFIFVYLYIYL